MFRALTFLNLKMVISWLLSMPGSSTTTQIEGFCISFVYLIDTSFSFKYYLSENPLKYVQVPILEVPIFLKKISKDVFQIQHMALNFSKFKYLFSVTLEYYIVHEGKNLKKFFFLLIIKKLVWKWIFRDIWSCFMKNSTVKTMILHIFL